MKLSISNIAWSNEYDEIMYSCLQQTGYTGIEIAPTRIFADNPYNKLENAKEYVACLKQNYELEISSMQSIWFGRTEKIFGSSEERQMLTDYTKKAIDFANAVGCKNLVFGCPKNRATDKNSDIKIAIDFFKVLGDYAFSKYTVLSMEANPVLYGTNFINTTLQAFDLVKLVASKGFKVNVDFGTILYNGESLQHISDNLSVVNHIHISEPGLGLIERRGFHNELAATLKEKSYENFVSIEMKNLENILLVQKTVEYIREVFE